MTRGVAAIDHLSSATDPDKVAERLTRDGAVIIDGLADPGLLARVTSEIMPFVDATTSGRDDFTGRQTTRTGALVARSPACRELVMQPSIIASCQKFLGPFTDRIQLHLTQVIRIKPEQGEQPLHRDRLAWGGFLPRTIEPQFNTIWALTDFTYENGATRVVPGSNTWPDDRKAERHEVGFAEMKAGSVLIYSGSVIHSGGRNQSLRDRIGINITYCLGWLRQEENQYLSCPPHIAKTLEPDLRALLGYSMGSYALGYFTPPMGPGEGPEVVPPEFLFNGKVTGWSDELYEQVSARVRDQLGEKS
jgi:ectoine hydroxylase-related dioxygenase (phytanoyl-CoA dioxygenase family)